MSIHDADDVAARWREGVQRAAARAYEAAHGSPISDEARGVQWRVSWRIVISVAAVLAVLAALVWWGVRPPQNALVPVAVLPVAASLAPTQLVIDVAGAVNAPGIVYLDSGARVVDAIAAAGGLAPNADSAGINQARVAVDGEQIYVPTQSEYAQAGVLNLNRATATELESLPGIGPALAQRIVADRDAHGPFATVADLERVAGIGPAVVAALAGLAVT